MRFTAVVVPASVALLASSALAQNLSERINHVMQTRAAAQATNTSKGAMLGSLLYTDVTVRFDQTPAREAITYLAKLLNISIVGRYSDDKTGNGIDPQTPITLDDENQPALTVLEHILNQCEDLEPCTWQLRDGFVEVGTKERLSAPAAREIRYYPIRDLLFEVPHFDNAPDFNINAAFSSGGGGGGRGGGGGGGGAGGGGGSGGGGSGGGGLFGDAEKIERIPEEERAQQIMDIITQTIEPDMWESGGGDAANIRYFQGTLIIRAPDFIQRQIGGYPFAIRQSASVAPTAELRYVTFSGVTSNVQIVGTKVITATGAVGGSGGASAGSPGVPAAPAPSRP